ncbi:low molecular weight phosphatase family protein [Microbacterium dauci]|uniref:Low molecular weight phosphatase family protein n=1 Tax=Microbacterium dauci TaxID=3048008 RepID=A0ABT6ZEB2_9MICO|nr:low molecular weight phosphatase family protein [Microbacterium sp. LX3-4]MDJ1114506.1 low molecular weight phosphatase family protein [Microbacterium sp. LX3-4]
MFEIMTVCTGNICRSPLAQQLLHQRLADLPHAMTSGGTFDMRSAEMPDDAQRLAVMLGVPADEAASHRSQLVDAERLRTPDLVIAMTREHRKAVVSVAPARLRTTFTARELGRLAASLSDDEIASAADAGGTDASARLRAAVQLAAGQRGMIPPPEAPEDDDVVDPYRLPWETYELMGRQLVPAVDQIARFVRIAVSG